MKSVKSLLLVCTLLLVSHFSQAQDSTASYFSGKWKVLVKGTPMGDVTMPVRFEIQTGKLKGFYLENGSTEEKVMDSVSVSEGKIFMAFRASNYDLTVTMSKKDDEHALGRLLDMFDIEATRDKAEEKK